MAIAELRYEDVRQFNIEDKGQWLDFVQKSSKNGQNHIVQYAAELAYQLELTRKKNGRLNNLIKIIEATECAFIYFKDLSISKAEHDKALCMLIRVWEYGPELFMTVSDYPNGFGELRKSKV